jgi:hypothetical protein
LGERETVGALHYSLLMHTLHLMPDILLRADADQVAFIALQQQA